MSSGTKLNAVFYAESYHPIQAGSIDGTDILPHDNAIYRAQLCSSAGLYDPFGDPKVVGDPYCTLFVGNLSRFTNEVSLHKAMSKYGRVKNLRLVRHIVTGASRGYAFVEYESEKEMRRAYEEAHHSLIDDYEVLVDYNRQQLMPGWIPRRLGGGLGGKKESGQLRFGGRERPFKAPLRPIPLDDLKRLGIPPPPKGKYMSRYQIPSPPRRKQSSIDRDDLSHDRSSMDREESSRRRHSRDREQSRRSKDRDYSHSRGSVDSKEHSHRKSSSAYKKDSSHKRRYEETDETSHRNSYRRNEEKPEKHRKRDGHSRHDIDRSRRSTSRDRSFEYY